MSKRIATVAKLGHCLFPTTHALVWSGIKMDLVGTEIAVVVVGGTIVLTATAVKAIIVSVSRNVCTRKSWMAG